MNRIPLNILVVEDDPDDLRRLKEAFERRKEMYIPTYAKSYEESASAMRNGLFHLVSIDQRLPWNSEDKVASDQHFLPVLEELLVTQPIATGVVLTAFGAVVPGIQAERHGLDYLQKGPRVIKELATKLNSKSNRYFEDVLVARGAERLPAPIARSMVHLRDQPHYRLKLLACRDLFESGIKFFTVILGAAALNNTDLRHNCMAIMKTLYNSDLNNESWKNTLKRLIDLISFRDAGYMESVYHETLRFMTGGSGDFMQAVDKLHNLRNELAHDRLKKEVTYKDIFENHYPSIHCLLEGLFFFFCHPLFDEFKVKGYTGIPVSYSASDLRGDHLVPRRIDIVSNESLPNTDLQWCLMKNNKKLIVSYPVFPLMITDVDHESQQTEWYLLHNVKRCEYRELTTGKSYILPQNMKQRLRKAFRE